MRTNLKLGSKKLLLILIVLIGGLSASALTRSETIFGPFGLLSGAFLSPTQGSNATVTPAAASQGAANPIDPSSPMFALQTTVDDQGPDDEPGQKDLNSMAVDFGLPGDETFDVFWNWDDTATSGANTRDGGALFDTDGDGFANYSLYITVETDGTWVTQLFICTADSRADRCGGPDEFDRSEFDSDATKVSVIAGSDPFKAVAGHQQNNDCDNNPACNTDDTVAEVLAVLSDFQRNPSDVSIALLNVCSYPSGEPNSDPSDCVVENPPGFLTLRKVVNNFGESGTGYLGVSAFPLTINGNPTTSGTQVSVVAGNYTIAETSQNGYTVGRWECSDGTNGTIGSVSAVVNVASGESVTCTMTNTLVANPRIDLVKTASTAGFGNPPVAGNKISYTFLIKNTGNVTLSGVDLDDTLLGYTDVTCGTTILAPDAQTSCTGDYTLTQADIDGGSKSNTATACGVPPAGAGNEVCDSDGTTTTIAQVKTINLLKTGTLNTAVVPPSNRVDAGDKVSYAFTVTNTGNVTLTNVTITDPLITVSGGPIASLAPGASNNTTFTGTYTLTQADIDAGTFTNTATACGTPPSGGPVCDPDDDTQTLNRTPHLSITKTATEENYNEVGDVIHYSIVASNDGNVTLSAVTVTDPKVTGLSCTPANGSSLAPGASMTCTATHTITQADIDAGHYANRACVDDGAGGAAEACADEDVPSVQTPGIELIKTGTFNDTNGDKNADVGETISYAFSVKNTGNVTLTNVTLADVVSGVTVSGGPIASLAPNATDTTTFTGSYVVTQADIDAGWKDNTAQACGTPPSGGPVCDPDEERVNLPQSPSLALDKSASPTSYDAVGQVITYTYKITNTGNTTQPGPFSVTDDKQGVISPCGSGPLAPGAFTTCTSTHTINQADLDAGSITNVACLTGTEVCDTVTVTGNPSLAIDLQKVGTLDMTVVAPANRVDAGDKVNYAFTIKNNSNVTLSNITLADTVGGVTIAGGPIATLAPGQSDSTTFTGFKVLSQADVDAGTFTNTATACGTPPSGGPVCDPDDDTQTLNRVPSLALDKSASPTSYSAVGQVITYTYKITNTGNTTQPGPFSVTDDKQGVIAPCGSGPLAPGAFTTCTSTHTINQADMDAGSITNVACLTGTEICDTVTVTGGGDPGINLNKVGTLNTGVVAPSNRVDAGDKVSYAFTVTNSGVVTLTNVTITDPLITVSGGPIASLAPGQSDSTTFTGTYTLTQADIDAGTFTNTAQACGTPPSGGPVCDPDDDTQTLNRVPSLTIVKSSTTALITAEGQVVPYSYLVTNTGNVTLTGITVTDNKVATVTCPQTSLAVGASMTCNGSHTVTASELAAGGNLTNIAEACGNSPSAVKVCDDDTLSIPIQPPPKGHIMHTGVTCSDFISNNPSDELERGEYGTKSGKVNNVAPGVMFYYASIQAPQSIFQINVAQSNNAGWTPVPVSGVSQILLYESNCTRSSKGRASYNSTTGWARIEVSGATPGATYIVGIKYSLSSLAGNTVSPLGEVAKYDFRMFFGSDPVAGSEDSISIFPKP